MSSGDQIETSFTLQFSQNVSAETNQNFLQQHWPLIDHSTGVSCWAGERMNLDMAVNGLK